MRILCDIGGTHARLGLADEKGGPGAAEKFRAAEFPSFIGILEDYRARHKPGPAELLIATAARDRGDGVHVFSHSNDWQAIDPAALAAAGFPVRCIVNDFYAAAWAITAFDPAMGDVLRQGAPGPGLPRVILGPGTGLGLAYALPLPQGAWHVNMTFGGHMLAATLTDEQHLIRELVGRLRGDGHTVVPEHLVSGKSLPVLYRAVCMMEGTEAHDLRSAEDVLSHAEDASVRTALRLMHEFLGLFAHDAIISGHAFGGLYLDGGMIQRLRERGLFDIRTVLDFMTLNPAPVVKERLEHLPVTAITDPFVAMRGLLELDRAGIRKVAA